MGFLDALLGGRGKRVKGAAPDRLFAMTTAQVTLDTGLGMNHKGATAIVFQPLETADFDGILKETEELLQAEGMNQFFIVPAGVKNGLSNMFATHPPIEARLEALRRMEREIELV